MNSHELQAAVVATDPQVIDSVAASLRKIGITSTVYRDTQSAIKAMGWKKLDAFFVDRELDPELSVLSRMRVAPGSRRSLGFAIIPGDQGLGGSFRLADFLMAKPLLSPRVDQTLRAAYGIMLKERMRYFRKSLRMNVTLVDPNGRSSSAVTTNISQGGFALESQAALPANRVFQVQFRLPSTPDLLDASARVVWSDDRGHAGLSFTKLNERPKQLLTGWLEEQFNAAMAVTYN